MRRVVWTEALDERLRALRWQGLTWHQISAEMRVGRNTVLERGRRLGVRRAPVVRPVVEDRDRPARPAGHPATWGLLVAGTVLEGSEYPFPVFSE